MVNRSNEDSKKNVFSSEEGRLVDFCGESYSSYSKPNEGACRVTQVEYISKRSFRLRSLNMGKQLSRLPLRRQSLGKWLGVGLVLFGLFISVPSMGEAINVSKISNSKVNSAQKTDAADTSSSFNKSKLSDSWKDLRTLSGIPRKMSVSYQGGYGSSIDKRAYGYWLHKMGVGYELSPWFLLKGSTNYKHLNSKFSKNYNNVPNEFMGDTQLVLHLSRPVKKKSSFFFEGTIGGVLPTSPLSKTEGFRGSSLLGVRVGRVWEDYKVALSSDFQQYGYKFDTKDKYGYRPSEKESLAVGLFLDSDWDLPIQLYYFSQVSFLSYLTETRDRLFYHSLSLKYKFFQYWQSGISVTRKDIRSGLSVVRVDILRGSLSYFWTKNLSLNLDVGFPDKRIAGDELLFSHEDTTVFAGFKLSI